MSLAIKREGEERRKKEFHDDWAKNVTSRVYVIQLTGTIFKLNSHIKETNVLTKFLFTCFHYIHIEKNVPPTCGHVFSPIRTIFELVRDINKTNVLTNFHDDCAKIVTSRENCPPTGSHVIQLTGTIFELNFHIKETNVLTKVFTCFHYKHIENVLANVVDDWANIVTSRVFTRKTAPPTGGHIFQQTETTLELNQHIIKTNILTNFELDRDLIGTKLLTKFHGDRTTNVASRVFTNKSPGMDNFYHVTAEVNAG
ncbi:hypothetical protein DPMN_080254 [Dreissena polymorpha]|uniref:Uncharacterized protein n=1 Tax=Dreissena polymorpha TaxID=45954 RepID=A0A9D3YTJ4_DREPO|nr:hypothetical protein DPMN_080254 [Dreissena polymorpha]